MGAKVKDCFSFDPQSRAPGNDNTKDSFPPQFHDMTLFPMGIVYYDLAHISFQNSTYERER